MNETTDSELTALLDGQLGEAENRETLLRLAADPALQHRLRALAQAREKLDAGFAALLAQAPVARLRAALPKEAHSRRGAGFFRARIAAALVMASLAGGLLAWLAQGVVNGREDWTAAVVGYMQFYTPETFANLAPDAAQQGDLVARVGARVGVRLTPGDLATPGLSFKTAFLLAYDGSALGEYVFTDAAGVPYLFCVLAEGEAAAARREQRQGFAVASWGRRDARFLVIGPSAEVIREWSKTLEQRT